MIKLNDGGPAFPPHWDPKTHPSGMSLRDYFAAKALPACITVAVDTPLNELQIAELAYNFADAMLKARKETLE